jgi:hypothetical protein
MAIAACFAFQREISSSVLRDFFDSIGHLRRFDRALLTSARPPTPDIPTARRYVSKVPKGGSSASFEMRMLRSSMLYPWLSAQTLDVSKYVDAIVTMTPIVMAASAKLKTANDQAL